MKWVDSTYNPLATITAASAVINVEGFDDMAFLRLLVDELKKGGIIVETGNELAACVKLLIQMKVINGK